MARRVDTNFEKLIIDNLIKKSLVEQGVYKGERRQKLEAKIAEHKVEYRRALKQKKYLFGEYGEIVNGGGDWDSFWQKVFFPGERWTPEEIKEFVDENWIHCEPGPYDCTGEVFTWAIDVFNVPAGVVAYLRYGIDV